MKHNRRSGLPPHLAGGRSTPYMELTCAVSRVEFNAVGDSDFAVVLPSGVPISDFRTNSIQKLPSEFDDGIEELAASALGGFRRRSEGGTRYIVISAVLTGIGALAFWYMRSRRT